MKIPISWLKEFVDVTVSANELAHRLTMAGLEVADVITIGGWNNCFVGYVEKVEKHPDADRLHLCTVNIGSDTQRVICGAPNVKKGQKVAFARVGANLIDGHTGKFTTLKSAKIRGVVSEGMVCSIKELGLGEDHDGILELPADAPLGMALTEYMGDYILDLEPTPNRSDWFSVLGVAYEVSALTGNKIHEPEIEVPVSGTSITNDISVTVSNPDLCPRYTASLIRGVVVRPSPPWLQDRLQKIDIRPINNVVDVTNYVMMEYGQPLHAFDYSTLLRQRILVRRAHTGEVIETLDGIPRALNSSHLVIADDRDARAIGGVIGGADSEITDKTTDVVLESASFDPTNNRQTAQHFRLRTEATIRFEKGLRPDLTVVALRRATQLIQQVSGGTVAKGIIDIYPKKIKEKNILLTARRINKILGTDYPMKQVEEVLTALGFDCQREDTRSLRVVKPYWRSDINIEDDLVEEVARIIGYDAIPTKMLSTPIPARGPRTLRDFREEIRDLLVREGLQEVISYPAVSFDLLKKIMMADNESILLKLANPMSRDYQYMRPTLRASLLRTLANNLSHQPHSVTLFEIGKIYLKRDAGLPLELETASGIFYGNRSGEGWLGNQDQYDFYDGKGSVEAILNQLGFNGTFEPSEDGFFHPGKQAAILVKEARIGILGEVHPLVQEALEISGAAITFFELDISRLVEVLSSKRAPLKPLDRYPSSIRDISILVDRSTPAASIQRIIESHPLVDRCLLFDVYEGDQVSSDKSSLAYRVYFQSKNRTLSSEEVNLGLVKVIDLLESQVGASLRGKR